jgi:subtilisin family serine protease
MSRRTVLLAAAVAALATVLPLSAQADNGNGNGPDRYIVVLKDAVDSDAVAQLHGNRFGASVDHIYKFALHGYSAVIPNDKVGALRRDENVSFVSEDGTVEALAQQAPTGIRRIGASSDGVTQTLPNDGASVGVAVIDTGIQLDHPDLTPVNAGKNCVRKNRSPADDNGHGSHVSGTIAARENGIGVVGVAPSASLYAVKVLNSAGSGSWSQVICGIDWVTANAATIKVANMSLGGSGTVTASNADCTNGNRDALHTAICRSVKAGVTYVVAAGNSAMDSTSYTPAGYSEVITVSALSDSDGAPGGAGGAPTCRTGERDDYFASFSNFGAPVDIAAPGVCIYSTWLGSGYNTISGTSMATPHVAGAAALYIAAHPGASPAQVKVGLQASATPGPIAGDPDSFKEGILHVP